MTKFTLGNPCQNKESKQKKPDKRDEKILLNECLYDTSLCSETWQTHGRKSRGTGGPPPPTFLKVGDTISNVPPPPRFSGWMLIYWNYDLFYIFDVVDFSSSFFACHNLRFVMYDAWVPLLCVWKIEQIKNVGSEKIVSEYPPPPPPHYLFRICATGQTPLSP